MGRPFVYGLASTYESMVLRCRYAVEIRIVRSVAVSIDSPMSIPLLICDDSNMARKQVMRALPEGWDVEVSLAGNGIECLEAIRAGKGEMVFLDLTMPEMDGYQVLEQVKAEGLKAVIIVISADIQPTARERVMQLGALDFIRKPSSRTTTRTASSGRRRSRRSSSRSCRSMHKNRKRCAPSRSVCTTR